MHIFEKKETSIVNLKILKHEYSLKGWYAWHGLRNVSVRKEIWSGSQGIVIWVLVDSKKLEQ